MQTAKTFEEAIAEVRREELEWLEKYWPLFTSPNAVIVSGRNMRIPMEIKPCQ